MFPLDSQLHPSVSDAPHCPPSRLDVQRHRLEDERMTHRALGEGPAGHITSPRLTAQGVGRDPASLMRGLRNALADTLIATGERIRPYGAEASARSTHGQ